MCVAISEVAVANYEGLCLIRGDQGRAIRVLLDRIDRAAYGERQR